MFSITINGRRPPTNKTILFEDKMLVLAQELLFEDMTTDNLFACGDSFTCKTMGSYGTYETFEGQVVSFQPKEKVIFTLISEEFVVTGSLNDIKVVAHQLDEYELSARYDL